MWKSGWKVLKTVKFKYLHTKEQYISKSNLTFSQINNASFITLQNKKDCSKRTVFYKFYLLLLKE